jgi:predicted nucleic acid-binding protein
MKVLLDTNIAQDAIEQREPFSDEAEKLIMLIANKEIEGCLSSHATTDIHYVVRKRLGQAVARAALSYLFMLFTIVDTSGKDCVRALELDMSDYEDAVMVCCAQREAVDAIISRDKKLLKTDAGIPIISPTDFLASHTAA